MASCLLSYGHVAPTSFTRHCVLNYSHIPPRPGYCSTVPIAVRLIPQLTAIAVGQRDGCTSSKFRLRQYKGGGRVAQPIHSCSQHWEVPVVMGVFFIAWYLPVLGRLQAYYSAYTVVNAQQPYIPPLATSYLHPFLGVLHQARLSQLSVPLSPGISWTPTSLHRTSPVTKETSDWVTE
jgi:hypothetical protein